MKTTKESAVRETSLPIPIFIKDLGMRYPTDKSNGLHKHPMYATWNGIIQKTTSKRHKSYDVYGGKGISMCDEWKNDVQAFITFFISKGWKVGSQVRRLDTNKSYYPENCIVVSKGSHLPEYNKLVGHI